MFDGLRVRRGREVRLRLDVVLLLLLLLSGEHRFQALWRRRRYRSLLGRLANVELDGPVAARGDDGLLGRLFDVVFFLGRGRLADLVRRGRLPLVCSCCPIGGWGDRRGRSGGGGGINMLDVFRFGELVLPDAGGIVLGLKASGCLQVGISGL